MILNSRTTRGGTKKISTIINLPKVRKQKNSADDQESWYPIPIPCQGTFCKTSIKYHSLNIVFRLVQQVRRLCKLQTTRNYFEICKNHLLSCIFQVACFDFTLLDFWLESHVARANSCGSVPNFYGCRMSPISRSMKYIVSWPDGFTAVISRLWRCHFFLEVQLFVWLFSSLVFSEVKEGFKKIEWKIHDLQESH